VLTRTRQKSVLVAAAVLLVVIAVSTAAGMSWFYPRVVTTVAVMVASLLAVLVVRAMLPRSWRSPGVGPVLLAGVAAYGFIRFGVDTHSSEFMDHRVLEPFEGEIDDFPTWFFGAVGAAVLMVFLHGFNWWVGRRSTGEAGGRSPRPAEGGTRTEPAGS
jgi:hypothetical protein